MPVYPIDKYTAAIGAIYMLYFLPVRTDALKKTKVHISWTFVFFVIRTQPLIQGCINGQVLIEN